MKPDIFRDKPRALLIVRYKANRFAIVTCLLLLIPVIAIGQNIPDDKILRYDETVAILDSGTCPSHEIVISNDTLEVAFLQAMTHYPELCGRKIRVQYGNIKTSMAAQPKIWSIFRKRDNRKYKIIINKNPQKAQTRLVYAAPFDACVGVMGHEIAHILDYSAKSGWQMIWTGIRYLGKKYRRNMERQTDSIAIVRGLGWQLYRYAYFVVYEAAIDDAYRKYKLDTYMKPEEIYAILKNNNQ